MTARGRIPTAIWPVPLLAALLVAGFLRPVLPVPAREAARFQGAPAAVAGLLWIQVASRIPFLDRVSPAEARMRARQLDLITRLDGANPEPWRYGTLGLALWGRPDLALDLGRRGLARFPGDHELRMMLHAALALNGPSDTPARLALFLAAGMDERLPPGIRLPILQEAAITARRDGRIDQAAAAEHAARDLARAIRHEEAHAHKGEPANTRPLPAATRPDLLGGR